MSWNMRKEVLSIWIVALSLSACSLPGVDRGARQQREFDFQTALELRNRDSDATEVIGVLGDPGAKKDLGEQGQLWSYFDGLDGKQSMQRLGILVDPNTGKIQSWTWLVRPGESLSELETLEKSFGGPDKFKKNEKESWIGGHASVRQRAFENAELGVSALMHGATNKVFVISLDRVGQANRSAATKP